MTELLRGAGCPKLDPLTLSIIKIFHNRSKLKSLSQHLILKYFLVLPQHDYMGKFESARVWCRVKSVF